MSEERAEWRLNPVTERLLAEGRQRERRRRRNVWLFASASIGLVPLSCFGTCISLNGGLTAWIYGPLTVVSVALLIVAVTRHAKENNAEPSHLLALREEFGGVGGWLVEMTVYQGEAISGRDVGIVWFEDERFYFTGARTSFGLGTEDPGGVVERSALWDGEHHLVFSLARRSEVGAIAIGLKFIAPNWEISPVVAQAHFLQAYRGWIASGAKTKGQMPPFTLGPDLPSRRSLQARAILATAVWPLLGVLILVAVHGEGVEAPMLLLLGLTIVVQPSLWRPRRSWLALRDRERLEAYNKD